MRISAPGPGRRWKPSPHGPEHGVAVQTVERRHDLRLELVVFLTLQDFSFRVVDRAGAVLRAGTYEPWPGRWDLVVEAGRQVFARLRAATDAAHLRSSSRRT